MEIKNHFKGIKSEKTALTGFSQKYTIEGIPKLKQIEYFVKITP